MIDETGRQVVEIIDDAVRALEAVRVPCAYVGRLPVPRGARELDVVKWPGFQMQILTPRGDDGRAMVVLHRVFRGQQNKGVV